jgi:(+)-neomenthol dehydrogenase
MKFQRVSNENARKELEDVDGLTEEKVDNVVERFLEDAKGNLVEVKGWPSNIFCLYCLQGSSQCLHKGFG